MSINTMKVFMKCPKCGHINFGYDYHENTSSERCEFFCVLNLGKTDLNATQHIGLNTNLKSEFVCEECKSEYKYDYLFQNGFCSVEDKEEYKRILEYVLVDYCRGRKRFICFSDWDDDFRDEPTVTEQPALDRLCMMYPDDMDFIRYSEMYRKCRLFGRDFFNKLELSVPIVSKEYVVVPSCLRKVYLHNGVQIIGESVFKDCKSLRDVFLPDSVTKICSEAFYKSGIETIHTSDNIKSIEDRAFGECTYLKKFFFPKNIEFIGDYCFENCRELSYLWIPDGVKIGEGAFSGCSGLKKVELPFSMKNLDLEYLGLQQDVVTYGK